MKEQMLTSEVCQGVVAELGGDEYHFDSWQYRVRLWENAIHFGYSREFDRWSNSIDLYAEVPGTVEDLKALLYWVCTRGPRVPRGGGSYFIYRREVQRVWKQVPQSVRRDFRVPPADVSAYPKRRRRSGVQAPRFRDMPGGRNKIPLRGRIPV